MKQFFEKLQIENIKKQCIETWQRFPLPSLALFLCATCFILMIHESRFITPIDSYVKIILSLVVFFFLSLSAKIYSEAEKLKDTQTVVLTIATIIFSLLFYSGFHQYIHDFQNAVYFLLTTAGIIMMIFAAPYLGIHTRKKLQQEVYYQYFYKVATSFLLGIILGGILTILGFIALGAITALFDLQIDNTDKLFADWAVFACVIIAPLFALGNIPQKSEFSEKSFSENAFFSFLIKYIATPFIYVYFLILYAYSVKVLSNFGDWPRGEVSWMVIGFSIFGYMSYIFSYHFEGKNNFIKTFRNIFPLVVIPQIGMLFYAIYLRVQQYDITINRYFVIAFGIWLLFLSVYYVFSKRKQLIIIPLSLTLMSLIISIGPWSVYNLPESRQLHRLENNLSEAGILGVNKSITPLSDSNDIDQDLSKEIYGGIEYLCKLNNCESIKSMFSEIYDEFLVQHEAEFEENKSRELESLDTYNPYYDELQQREYTEPSSWEIVRHITDTIKVKNYFEASLDQEFIFVSLDYSQSFFPIDTTGYSEIYEIRGDREVANIAYFDVINNRIILPDNTEYDMTDIVNSLTTIYNTPGLENPLRDPSLLQFETEEYKIYIRNINLENPQFTGEKSEFPYYSAQGYILIQ